MSINSMRAAQNGYGHGPRGSGSGKSARLKKWGDDDGDVFDSECFGDNEDFLRQLNETNDEVLTPAEDCTTIKFAPVRRNIGSATNVGKDSGALKPGFLRGYLNRFVEDEDEGSEISFGEELQPDLLRNRVGGFAHAEYGSSSGAASSLSPVHRRTLSDFNEDTDTDITEINDDDFGGVDDIFGKEDSGIYSSGGTRVAMKQEKQGRAQEILVQRKKQLEEQAMAEDIEYFQRYHNTQEVGSGGAFADACADEVTTLKIKDLRLYNGSPSRKDHDAVENDVTINYEYTKDDYESFVDGFVGDLASVLRQDKLTQFQTGPVGPGKLQRKASMPLFPRSLKASKPTKFRSSMDLVGSCRDKSEHPLFNNNNNIIRKLDRMPSFHTKKASDSRPPSSEDLLDYNMELHKKKLLEKYMEISEKQFQLRSSPKRKVTNHSQKPMKKGVGIVRYLNKTSAPSMATNKQMKFNVDSNTWDGNEHDLLRFDETKEDGIRNKNKNKGLNQSQNQNQNQNQNQMQPKPSLITLTSFQHKKETVKGDMVYDAENLRWVNKNALSDQEDVFEDLSDLVPNDIPQYTLKASASSGMAKRGVSTFTQRTVSTVSTGSSVGSASAGEEFVLNAKLMARFEKEEAKIRKKTHQWFTPNETYHLKKSEDFDFEYFWDIRKMVMDNET